MLNYKKDDLKVVYDQLENNNFFVEWNLNTAGDDDVAKIHVMNVKVRESLVKEIKKVEIVYRVNFLALFLHKSTVGKFWEKEAIITVNFEEGQDQYNSFKAARETI
jgi:hypothetical protein